MTNWSVIKRKKIKTLISWLGWEWNKSYLSPHLNLRTVSIASNIQVRSPINSNLWRFEELQRNA